MYKIYLDNILQADGDIYDFNTAFDITIIREDGFSNDEQILREKSEVEIKMCGGAYAYIIGKMQEDLCSEILVTIVDESCALIYNGQIKANTIKTYPKTKTAAAKIFDMLFSADLRDVIDTDTQTYLRRTKNCGYIEIEPIVISMNLDPDTIATRADVQCYDALSLLDYIVKYHTDGTSYVYSDFLTNTKFAITTGFNMHDFGVSVEEIYPTVSFNQVFEEIRKKERIYMEVQRDDTGVYFIRVEHEDFFFEDSMLFTIDGIPEGTTQEYDAKRNFSSIEVGSNETDLEDTSTVYYPQDELTAWNEEVYKFCGTCAAEKDSKLDLINEFIIDSNLIYEAVNAGGAEYNKDSNLFMFRYETNEAGTVPILDLDADSNTYVYNLDINNEQTLNKWVDYAGKCIQKTRLPRYYFSATDMDGATFAVPAVFIDEAPPSVISYSLPYPNVLNAWNIISSNYFLCQENGNYNFRCTLSALVYAGTQYFDTLGGECDNEILFDYEYETVYTLSIRVFTDSTKTTLSAIYTNTFTATVTNATPPTILTVTTGDLGLIVGNVVDTYLTIEVVDARQLCAAQFLYSFKPVFELVSDSFACENIVQNDANTRPYLLSFEYPICYDDFTKARNNKRGYILVNGLKYHIKELEYTHNSMSKLKLIGNQLMQ